ncbi:heavy-metal-associated domain-containing protein [Cryobacterium sp.]|jgi:copper chaperone|uniref:heavy-metal-associated domain-containing protein n=1 Tax=Cryobacterium sp. TaxID=1926290 RepID=UPI00261931FA|nr:heavy metal-associated domain-containing protein [Cryobacterium sp.]MCU1446911.1 heavy metal transporter [Cryobacterium sp.]
MTHSDSTTTHYLVTGMTCGHCVTSVIEEVSLVPGVHQVTVELLVGAASTVHVTSATAPAIADIRAAITEAGYSLTDSASEDPAA